MLQPKKIEKTIEKKVKQKISRRKRNKITVPIRKEVEFWVYKKYKISKQDDIDRQNLNVQSSKLEYMFMRNFLDKLGVKYIHQWESPAKFVYDFAILTQDGNQIDCLIEVDGDFWHMNPKTNIGKVIYESQKKQIKRYEEKNKWAAYNGILLLRFWENDIHKNPQKVLSELKKRLITNKK